MPEDVDQPIAQKRLQLHQTIMKYLRQQLATLEKHLVGSIETITTSTEPDNDISSETSVHLHNPKCLPRIIKLSNFWIRGNVHKNLFDTYPNAS